MKKLADFILSGYGQAAFSVASLAWLASFIPLVGILSSAALTLVALRWGGQRAGIVLMLSTLLLLVFFTIASFAGVRMVHYPVVLLFVLLQWIPVIAIAHLLRRTESLSFTLNVIVLAGVSFILLVALLVPERTELWNNLFSGLIQESSQEVGAGTFDFAEEYRAFLEVMTGVALTSLVLIWTTSLLLARWWENLLGTPGGFRAEFTALNLGKAMAVFGIILFTVVYVTRAPLMHELLMVVAYAFFLQGIATAHYLLNTLNNASAWLFAFYAALVFSPFLPQVPGAVSALGALENLINFRSRRGVKSENRRE